MQKKGKEKKRKCGGCIGDNEEACENSHLLHKTIGDRKKTNGTDW